MFELMLQRNHTYSGDNRISEIGSKYENDSLYMTLSQKDMTYQLCSVLGKKSQNDGRK